MVLQSRLTLDSVEASFVHVSFHLMDEHIFVQVRNSITSYRRLKETPHGIRLLNLIRRFELLYGSHYLGERQCNYSRPDIAVDKKQILITRIVRNLMSMVYAYGRFAINKLRIQQNSSAINTRIFYLF